MKPPQIIMGGGLDIVRNGLTVWLDANREDSYSSGQTWTDLMGLSDMYRGATSGSDGSDPTFNTGAPNYFSTDGGDYFTSVNANAGTLVRTWGRSNSPFSLEMWAYFTGLSTATKVFAGNFTSGPSNYGAIRESGTVAGNLVFEEGAGATSNLSMTVTQDAWTQVVWTILTDGATTCTAYERAVSEATGTISTSWSSGDSNGNFTIWGTTGGLVLAPSGTRIAVLRLYNRILTADEVLQNYQAERGRFGV